MELVALFLERAAYFEKTAAGTADPSYRAFLERNAHDYHKLAETRAERLGHPLLAQPKLDEK